MRLPLVLLALGALAPPLQAQSLQVIGQAGYLGEWELIASVTAKAPTATKEFSGPLTMTHVGFCTQDGPEAKTGEIRFQLFEPLSRLFQLFGNSSRIEATLLVDGIECTFSGSLTDAYTGMMSCPDRRAVPLTLWVR